jgi:hypothetical protein
MSDFPCNRLTTLPARWAVTDRQKKYAVGLEKQCPGGAQCRAPEIPSGICLAGQGPGKCELVHKPGRFCRKQDAGVLAPRSHFSLWLSGLTTLTVKPGSAWGRSR